MKQLFYLSIFALFFSFSQSNAQDYQAIGGTVGLINTKVRLQYEKSLSQRATVGTQLTYYLVNWTGPKLEVFGRLYSKKRGIDEGFFLQGKLGYGNLSILEDDLDFTEQKRWSTFGGGLGTGWKFMFSDRFGVETIVGLHIYTQPNYDVEDEFADLGEDIGWFLTTGLPLDFQLKLVYTL